MDVFVEFHDAKKVLFEFFKLSSVGYNYFFLFVNNFSEFIGFFGVKIDSVLKIWTFLFVLSFLRLVLIFLLNFFNQLSQVSVLFGNFSDRALIMELITILFITVLLRLNLGWTMVKGKLTVLNSWLWSNDDVLNWSLWVCSAVGHYDCKVVFILNLLMFYLFWFEN